MHKFSVGLKSILIKKLTVGLTEKMSLAEFNEVFLYLDICASELKIVPYGIFEEAESREALLKTSAGAIFDKWLECKTGKIDKDFNKGRKLVRVFREIVSEHKDVLAFNLSSNTLFTISLTSLFVDYSGDNSPISFEVNNEETFKNNLASIRDYLASIFFIDMINDTLVAEKVLSIFINEDVEYLLDSMIYQGTIYSNGWGMPEELL